MDGPVEPGGGDDESVFFEGERLGPYRVSLSRSVMKALAPEADADLLHRASLLLDPINAWFEKLDMRSLEGASPATTFDPLEAAGSRTWRQMEFPPAESPPIEAPADEDLPWTGLADLAALIRAGEVSALEVVRTYLTRVDALDPTINAFITNTGEDALAMAQERRTGRLAGVPIGLKDVIDTDGVRTTCGSPLCASRVPTRDARCWELLFAEGAILIGKLGTHEFAAGTTSENDFFGTVRNPWDPGRVAGGSSGGSAAGVSAALVAGALGSDTGGSIRIPAACCGAVGLKPTFGIVETRGVQTLAWSLDHVGPITRTVRDAALLVDILSGTSCEAAALSGGTNDLSGTKVGVPAAWLEDLEPTVRSAFDRALQLLQGRGAELVEAGLPFDLDDLAIVNRAIIYAEASALHEHQLRVDPNYGAMVRPRKEAGRFLLAGTYLAAQRVRAQFCRALSGVWRDADVLAMPTMAVVAPSIGAESVVISGKSESVGTALVRFTAPFSLAGVPALSIPCWSDVDGLPVGLQIVAPPFEDARACFVAASFEHARGEFRRPPLAMRL